MFTSQLSAQPIAVRHTQLIADADAVRLARRLRLAGAEHRVATAPHLRLHLRLRLRLRRSWLRTATQPAHLCQPTQI